MSFHLHQMVNHAIFGPGVVTGFGAGADEVWVHFMTKDGQIFERAVYSEFLSLVGGKGDFIKFTLINPLPQNS